MKRGREMSEKEIAKVLGVSRGRVSHIIQSGLRKLRLLRALLQP